MMKQHPTGTAPSGRVVSVQVGRPRALGDPEAPELDRPWTSAIIKQPVHGLVWLGRCNLEGDQQADRKVHGGPDKAVCVYPAAHYRFWRDQLRLAELAYGAFGENVTIAGLCEESVCIGDIFAWGAALVQVSQPRQPCWKLARRWRVKDLAALVQQSGRTGWYMRVLHAGQVAAGQPWRLVERPFPQWAIARANQVMHQQRGDRVAAAELAACPALAASWRATLTRRVERGEQPEPRRRLLGPDQPASGATEP